MNNNFHDEFMDNADLDDIDNLILSQAGSGDLIDKMQEKNEAEAAKKVDWMGEFKRHKFTYILLGCSAVFTVMLAVYLGLAPTLQLNQNTGNQEIHFNTDFGHIVTMLVYVLVFPGITEVAFAVARIKFKERETGNFWQAFSMFVAMAAAVISIIGTGVAGGYVVASTIGFLKKFAEIPDSVQNWIVWIIPSLLAIYAVLYTIYELSSRIDRAERFVKEQERRELLNHELRRRQIDLAGKRKTQAAAIYAYERLVLNGVLSQQQADTALSQGKSIGQLEKDLNRDLTGEGGIGNTSGLQRDGAARRLPTPQPVMKPQAPSHPTPPHPHKYTLAEFLEFLAYTPQQALNLIDTYTNDEISAWNLLQGYEMIPVDMTFGNFRALYGELHVYPTPAARPLNGQNQKRS